jgi:hypothetical protein
VSRVDRDARRVLRRLRRRRIGAGLIAFGVTGLVLTGAAGALVLASLRAVDDAASGFEEQRAEIVAMLGPASAALEGAAASAANAGTSLASTRDAATQAAELMTRLSASFESLAALGTFEILGARPFATLSGQFTDVAAQSRTLSADLAMTAGAMQTNIADSTAVAEDLRALAAQLDTLEASLGSGGDGGIPSTNAGLPIAAAQVVLVGLLLWLAVPAIAAISLGLRWRRAAPRDPPSG